MPNSPNRSELYKGFLVKRLGQKKYDEMKQWLKNQEDPANALDE